MTVNAETLKKLSPEDKRRLLEQLLEQRAAEPQRAATAPIDRHAPFPLNDMQQAFWIGRSGAVQLGNIGIHGYLEIECEDLDVDRAARAFRQLIARHDMLRAIVLPDGTQRVLHEVPPFEIAFEDLAAAAETERSARCAALREQLSHQVFDVQRWPLFDIRAARISARTTLLFLSIDLIIADTKSVVLLFREWADFYHHPDRALPPLQYGFQQYTLDEPALATTEPYLRAQRYWEERVPRLPDAPQLPLRVDPGAIAEPRFVRHESVLDAARWSRLKALGQTHGLTPSVLMCAAYVEVLERWSTSPHFTLNVIPSLRRAAHPEVDRVIGPFSAIDLLEIDLRASASFVQRAQALQARLYEDLDHMQYNGVKVLRKLAQRRGSGLSALMPIVFTSTMLDFRDLEGLGRIRYMITQTPQVWIDHQLAEREGALWFNWDVVEELFPPGMMAEMFAAFGARVRQLADDPQALERGGEDVLPAAGLAARRRANDTAGSLRELALHEAVWQRARETPQAEAVVSSARRLTYGELMCEAQQLASRLRARGVGRQQIVAVSLPKGWQQVVAVLGVLDAGGAYLPLDPSLPVARRQLLLERAGCAAVVSAPEHASDLPAEWQSRVVPFEAAEEVAGDLPPVSPAPSDLAYVIFTSGSTGVPKGVMISHRAALNTLDDINARFGVGPRDRVLGLSSLSFDLSVYDVFGVLAAGGCLVLPEPGRERDPAHWLEWLRREHVTIWNSVPALMRMLVEHAADSEPLARLRLVMLSGDWIPVTLPAQIRALAPEAAVVSLGGATEASIWSIHYVVDAVDPTWTSIPYGRPLRNQRFHVRDGALRDCPTWVAGELFIAGEGLAEGYLGDPERTQASFVVDASGERLYRTGDLGRYLPDGTIEFLGRRDAQVKVSGHRIELEEIESHLARHPAVRAAVVRAIGERHDKRLVAYVVSAEPGAQTGAALRAHLAEHLPEYMVPRHVLFLDALPLTDNGKIDASKLPLPETLASSSTGAPAAADAGRSQLERAVIEVWQSVLGCGAIAAHTNFFDLGGDSLRMVRVRRQLIERLSREINMLELYSHPSPAQLAQHLSSVADPAGAPAVAASAGKSRAARRLRALGSTEAGR